MTRIEPALFVEDEEQTQKPMTDRDHLATFGWAWDDPDKVE